MRRRAARRGINFHGSRVRIPMNNNKAKAYETADAAGSLCATLTFGLTSFMQIPGTSVSRGFFNSLFLTVMMASVTSVSRLKFMSSDRCVSANENN